LDIFIPADILIPKEQDMSAWSVVACDQFTSEPEYWEKAYAIACDKPSTLHMILPEAELGRKDPELESKRINLNMAEYLDGGIFRTVEDSFVLVERRLGNGKLRRGIVGALDMEAYDWHEGTFTPIRATEHTVEDRLPPRIRVREEALLEMPHIMVFFDDPRGAVLSAAEKGELLYDFELMLGGGHIRGWKIADNAAVLSAIEALSDDFELVEKYGTADKPIIFAMGDGNHSIAAAKQYWESVKKTVPESERAFHPARFALAELVNIHDEAIDFEPIHKVIFNTEPESFFDEADEFFSDKLGNEKSISLVSAAGNRTLSLGRLTSGELIAACEDFCKTYTENHGGYIDYIHGDTECLELSAKPDSCGILLPRIEKTELFSSVMNSGPFPKKSFSIGLGPDKRYYLECRRIK